MCGGETGVKVREGRDLLDEGKSATKDAEAQQLNSFGDYIFNVKQSVL